MSRFSRPKGAGNRLTRRCSESPKRRLWHTFPSSSFFLSPAAYFLSTATKSMQKTPPETDGFWTSFCVQELLPKFRRSRESAFFYSRCRYIGWLKGVVLLPGESILPSGRTTSFFIWAGAAAGLLLSQFPRHLISNETLEGKGNPKTIGFCWRSLVPFCPEANTHHFSRIFLCFFR